MVDSPFPRANPLAEDAGQPPVSVRVHGALVGSVADQTVHHAEALFVELEHRGPAAWREAAVLLIQQILSTEEFGEGEEAAQQYLAEQVPAGRQPPSLAVLHTATAAFIAAGPGDGPAAAERVLDASAARAVSAATRFLFIVAAGCWSAGLAPERLDHFLHRLTPDLV